MSRRAPPVLQHHQNSPQQIQSNTNTNDASSPKRFDHIVTARRQFGTKVNLSGLGPGNERVVAAELLLIHAAGGPSNINDVTKSSIPFPRGKLTQFVVADNNAGNHNSSAVMNVIERPREATQLDVAAWELISAYRNLWIEAWSSSDTIRTNEAKARREIYRLAKKSSDGCDRISLVQAIAWKMIEEIELDVRDRVEHEEELVFEGLMHYFRRKKNELEIEATLNNNKW